MGALTQCAYFHLVSWFRVVTLVLNSTESQPLQSCSCFFSLTLLMEKSVSNYAWLILRVISPLILLISPLYFPSASGGTCPPPSPPPHGSRSWAFWECVRPNMLVLDFSAACQDSHSSNMPRHLTQYLIAFQAPKH